MARKCFYSFHYKPDCWRAATVRGIGVIEGNEPASDNEWEAITSGPNQDQRIERWIAQQMAGRTCNIVLVGSDTAGRKWINYEIVKAWTSGLGVVGINIHGLKDRLAFTSSQGRNPFDFVTYLPTQRPLSTIARCYNPDGLDTRQRYAWIEDNLERVVEEAIRIRAVTA